MRLTGHDELYGVAVDTDETINLADLDGYDGDIALMSQAIKKWFSFYEDPFISGWTKPVTGGGQIHSVLYNVSGMSTTPAFAKLSYLS